MKNYLLQMFVLRLLLNVYKSIVLQATVSIRLTCMTRIVILLLTPSNMQRDLRLDQVLISYCKLKALNRTSTSKHNCIL